eukprot:3152334-Rhodomonas_salina.1
MCARTEEGQGMIGAVLQSEEVTQAEVRNLLQCRGTTYPTATCFNIARRKVQYISNVISVHRKRGVQRSAVLTLELVEALRNECRKWCLGKGADSTCNLRQKCVVLF